MRSRESVSNELDRQGNNSYSSHAAEYYIGKCIKYLADTLYLIHLEKNTIREKESKPLYCADIEEI